MSQISTIINNHLDHFIKSIDHSRNNTMAGHDKSNWLNYGQMKRHFTFSISDYRKPCGIIDNK